MDEHTLSKLEYPLVLEQIREFAACGLGLAEIDALTPSSNATWITDSLKEVAEARLLSDSRGHMPLGGIRDIRQLIEKAAVSAMLQPKDLLEVAGTLISGRRLKGFLTKDAEKVPRLAAWARQIGEFPKVEEEIRRCIGDKGEVVDSASPQLGSIRSRLRTFQGRISEKLQSILRTHKTMIQEPVITLRDDRYCIPVKAEHRREFGGLVHDQSSSGATVFMEPQVVVELGNELRELMIKERHEIERILAQISALVAARAFDIQTTVHALGHLDMVSAKARWADSRRCVEPELDSKGSLVFYGARHPLLQGDVVPIDVRLGGDFTALLITGPNTGGKTVTLKTVGLLTLLAQSGLHIPADPGTRVAIFRNVFADIGDEQSIQQSLSTFSSHIRQISRIVTEANNQSLVLLDEIGAGTDPQEGAALAKSILAFLMERGVRIMASTHYGELKEFAMTAPGVENASVEFNHETLSPTYRLLVGVPGASNALNIASRLGLNKSIIDGARKMVDPDRRSLEEAYLRMEERRLAAEKAESSARQSLAEIEKLKREYQREYQALRNRKEETTRKAAEQARDVVRRAQDEAKQILSDLRKAGREDRSTEQARQRLSKLNATVASQMETVESPVPTVREDLHPKPAKESPALDKGYQELEAEPEVGDEVIATSFGRQGVLRRREGKDAEVQFGAMRMTVPVSTLRKITRTGPSPARREAQRMGAISVQAASTVPSEIHLRGMRAEEALVAVDEYLDQARLAGLRTLRLVHGKGTGALRKVLWSHLKDDPSIKSFTHPPEEEGGAGATVVEFKD